MKHLYKQLAIFTLTIIMVLAFTTKLDTHAEKVLNTAGEKHPWTGKDYEYKYWTGREWEYTGSVDYAHSVFPNLIDVTYDVTYDYEEAYKMLDMVNEVRRKAGVPELQVKDELMKVSMERAAETNVYWSHTRPDSSPHSTISFFAYGGENLCAHAETAQEAMEAWINSPGHYANMINSQWAYVGFGCVAGHWVQTFLSGRQIYWEDGFDEEFRRINGYQEGVFSPNDKPVIWDQMPSGQMKNYSEKFTAHLNPEYITDFRADIDLDAVEVGDSRPYRIFLETTGALSWKEVVSLSPDQFEVKVLTPDIISYVPWKTISADGNSGAIRALKPGKAKIQFTLKENHSFGKVVEFSVAAKPVKKGSKVTVGSNRYKVTGTKSNSRTVSLFKGKHAKTVTIPKTVKIQGKTYKVTAIASGAFSGDKNLKKITVGANVSTIGSKAFYGCKNLKKITIQSKKLKSVGKNALKGIHKKAVIKVPKSRLTKYKKLFKGKGQKKTVKIKK